MHALNFDNDNNRFVFCSKFLSFVAGIAAGRNMSSLLPCLAGQKAEPYAEVRVDGVPGRKTDVKKKTWNPVWDENFNV